MRRKIVLIHKDTKIQHIFDTQQKAGDFLGVSKQRVHQLLKTNRIHKFSGYNVFYGEEVISERQKYQNMLNKIIVNFNDVEFVKYKENFWVSKTGQVLKMLEGKLKLQYCIQNYTQSKKGYIRVNSEYLHRVIGKMFIPNPDNKPQINHIDGNKCNNHANNLEWVTAKENVHHAIDILKKHGSLKNKENNKLIKHLLINTKLSLKEIAEKIECNINTVSRTNLGYNFHDENEEYPIRIYTNNKQTFKLNKKLSKKC